MLADGLLRSWLVLRQLLDLQNSCRNSTGVFGTAFFAVHPLCVQAVCHELVHFVWCSCISSPPCVANDCMCTAFLRLVVLPSVPVGNIAVRCLDLSHRILKVHIRKDAEEVLESAMGVFPLALRSWLSISSYVSCAWSLQQVAQRFLTTPCYTIGLAAPSPAAAVHAVDRGACLHASGSHAVALNLSNQSFLYDRYALGFCGNPYRGCRFWGPPRANASLCSQQIATAHHYAAANTCYNGSSTPTRSLGI